MPGKIDEVLDILHRTGPEFGGLSNHGPMAAEAILALDRPDLVFNWVEQHKDHLDDRPSTQFKITQEDWREALGNIQRVGDWVAFFDEQLAESSWQQVVGQWVPRLAPALMAAATHGLIRTGHAVRSLSQEETPQRLHELAQGLGYWAARYQVLPGTPADRNAGLPPADALKQVKRLHGPDFTPTRLIFEELKDLDDEASFTEVINLVGTDGDLSQFLSNTTETFARVFLANDNNLVSFVHAVTAPSILRVLAPYLSDADARLAARYAWQAGAALYTWFVKDPHPVAEHLPAPAESPDELIDRAIAAGGAHTIKFTEACLREYALNPNPVYLVAAKDVAERIPQV